MPLDLFVKGATIYDHQSGTFVIPSRTRCFRTSLLEDEIETARHAEEQSALLEGEGISAGLTVEARRPGWRSRSGPRDQTADITRRQVPAGRRADRFASW